MVGRNATAALVVGLGLALSACVDPNDAAQRAVAGGVLGAGLGAGLGASFALNPGLGAAIGAAGGGLAGAATGIITTPPPVTYAPIAAPGPGAAPSFYDTWPPGFLSPPPGAGSPPPPALRS